MQKLPRWYGCAVGAGAVALAALARYALHGSLGSSAPLVAFVPAVFVAAAVGGVRAGLATTALALTVGLSAFVPVAEWDTPGFLVRGALFAAVGATISAALERLGALGALTAEQRQALADAEAYLATVEEARRRNSQGSAMRAMLQVATSVLASASHEEAEVAVDEVLGIIGRFAHADRAYIFHFDWERRLANNTHEWCADGTAPMIDRLRNVPMEEAKELVESIVEGRLRWIPDVSALTSEKERSFLEAQGIQSILMMPLMHQGRCVGLVGFDWVYDKVRVLQDTHVESLEVFSGLLLTHLGRVSAWRALEESEQRYRLLFSSMTQGVVVHDGTGAIIDCNKSAETILGFTRDMILGRDSHDPQWRAVRADGTPCPGEEHPTMVVLRTRQPCLGVIMGLAKSATTRWIRINAAPAVSANNDTIVFATFDDITAEREADTAIRLLSSQIEQDLRDREREVRDVLDNLPTFVALIDTDGTVRWVNRAPLQAGGLTPEDVVGRKFWDCPWWTHDPAQIARVRDTILAAVAGQRARYDATIRGAGDTRVEIDFQVEVVRDAAGAVRYVIPAAVDVTDRRRAERAVRESEERFRAVFESLAEGVVVQDAAGAIMTCNDRACAVLGLTRDQMTGRTSVDLRWRTVYEDGTPLPGEEHPSMRVLRTGLPVFDSVMGIHTPDGELRWLLVNAVPVRCTGDGPGPATVASFHDITAARALDERVRASLREKELLLKEIHHRVKNNLQIVSTLLDLQSDFTTDRAALTMFAESRSRVKSMALVHERLYKSHDVARVDLGDYTRALAADLFRAYRASDEVVRLDVDVTAPPLSLDVAIPCGLLLNELMSNCFKHAFADGRTGTLRVALAADGGAHELTVADDGPGLPPGYDFRNAASFGLQLVSTLVEQLGGTIGVGGPGATFTVRFRTSPK